MKVFVLLEQNLGVEKTEIIGVYESEGLACLELKRRVFFNKSKNLTAFYWIEEYITIGNSAQDQG